MAITILADHKGMTTPKVSGDEYYVDAVVDMDTGNTDYDDGILVTGAELGLSRINAVMITGQADLPHTYHVQLAVQSGAYELADNSSTSTSSFVIRAIKGASGANTEVVSGDNFEPTLRIRVYGLI